MIENQRFYNPVDYVLQQIGGTWKAPVLWRIRNKPQRYTAMQKDIPHISQKMLSRTLKELERDGLVSKKVFPQVPPHTEYTITPRGAKLIKLIEVIRKTGIELLKEEGVDYEELVYSERKNARTK